ncbi:low molecular weight protein-tyrosine-phosphatase [Ectothiorhodospira mobilis]|uniref:low molecular weight protein-tyrosine-phosphatase n=1 Tax=Ectothiorhodospira mobilis TaxID=195064 RepID=UPI001F5BF150|nr:low molecular weight protein-tyrosine-phosphatase [Ectothiorhodospira mobilis]
MSNPECDGRFMMQEDKVSVLMVCLGNICRSPTAQGVLQWLLANEGLGQRVLVDSAGTHAYHVGEPPDPRARRAALQRGIDLSGQRARRVERQDLEHFDYVLAMDRENLAHLQALAPGQAMQGHLGLFMAFAHNWEEQEVPDPYYGGDRGFERVLDMVEDASRGLLQHIRERQGVRG